MDVKASEIRSSAKIKLNKLLNKSSLSKENVGQSRQRLVSENSSEMSEEESIDNKEEIIKASVHQTDKNYVMEKFLQTASGDEDISKFKAPVPRPRTKKSVEEKNLSDNSGTYTISPENNDSKNKNDALKSSLGSTYTRSISMDSPIKENIDFVEIKGVENSSFLYEETQNQEGDIHVLTIEKNSRYEYKNLINIIIHSCDRLELESCVIHPVVKIHVMDINTGTYLTKSDKSRNVLFYYENKNIDYIGPILTKTYNLQENRSIFPKWEEPIILNEDFNYFKENQNIMLFFEVLDFLNFNQVNQENKGDGWINIAWAFLCLNPPNFSNANKKVRLQLYRPRKNYKKGICNVYNWWKHKNFLKYPSTIYITVESIPAPSKIIETLRSKTPLEAETARAKIIESKPVSRIEELDIWKLPNNINVFKVPNSLLVKLDTYDYGCYFIKFSNSGKYLACAVSEETNYMILIYSFLENTNLIHLSGHCALIYNIVWSKDDHIIISASADSTVCVWDTTNFILLQVLTHPSFVYSCDIRNNTIVTGCYDGNIRIWDLSENEDFKLVGEYKGHKSYITSTCFNKEGNIFYSSDSIGIILGWKVKNNEWNVRREIEILDLKQIIIDQIILVKNERRLIVNSRDNLIRLIDIRTGFVLNVYSGSQNSRFHINCSLTACETYIFSGSESGDIFMWSTDTAKVQHTFKPYDLNVTIHCVDFNSSSNFLAISHYGNNLPILIYKHTDSAKKQVDYKYISSGMLVHEQEKSLIETTMNKEEPSFKKILEKMDNILSESVI